MCRVCCCETLAWEPSTGLGHVVLPRSLTRRVFAPRLVAVQLDEGAQVDAWVIGEPGEELCSATRVGFVEAASAGSSRLVFTTAGWRLPPPRG
jgi:hypothetical protein